MITRDLSDLHPDDRAEQEMRAAQADQEAQESAEREEPRQL